MFFLQILGTAMGTILALTYANLTMPYHEIEVYYAIKNTFNLEVSFEDNCFQFIDLCEILLYTNLTDLLTNLNQVNPNLQFTMEREALLICYFKMLC